MREQKAFTSRVNGRIREIRTSAGLFKVEPGEEIRSQQIVAFHAIWDTGASNTAIASSVTEKLNISPVSYTRVSTGGGEVHAPVYLLNIVLPNNVIIPNVKVTALKGISNCDVLIGMDIISLGDFALTHVGGKACFSFRIPSSRCIDFVPESNSHNRKVHSKVNKSKKNKPKRKKVQKRKRKR